MNDLTIYSNYAHEWWAPGAMRFRSLQKLTPFRMSLIREAVPVLKGKKIGDLGCGGGLLSIPLLDEEADIIGVDLSQESLDVAAAVAGGRGRFIQGDITALPIQSESLDVVVLADVLDHVPHFVKALREATRVLVPGGALIVGTINRSWWSWALVILLGESLRLIPPGTHDYKLFIRPDELIESAQDVGLELVSIQGEWPRFFSTIAHWAIDLRRSRTCVLAYTAVFRKRNESQ